MKTRLGITLAAAALLGCPWPINQYNADRYHEVGVAAERSGDLERAREAFRRAAINADLGHAPVEARALAAYDYGRVSGYLCLHDEAEQSLRKSLEIQEGDRPATARLRPPALLELARLYFDTDRCQEALEVYEEGIALVRPLGVAESDPIRFALTLEEYGDCLAARGREEDAHVVRTEAAALRAAHPNPMGPPPFSRYNARCGP